MSTLDERLDAIAAAPEGPQIAAFFDYDGTVIDNFSAAAFYRHRIRHFEIGPVELAKTLLGAARGIDSGEDFEEFLKMALGAWRGHSEEEIRGLGERLFKHEIAGRMHWEAWRLVQAHHAMGHYREALVALQESVKPLRGPLRTQRFGMTSPPSVAGYTWQAWCHAERGEFAQALASGHEALQIADEINDPWGRAGARFGIGLAHLLQGNFAEAIDALADRVRPAVGPEQPVFNWLTPSRPRRRLRGPGGSCPPPRVHRNRYRPGAESRVFVHDSVRCARRRGCAA